MLFLHGVNQMKLSSVQITYKQENLEWHKRIFVLHSVYCNIELVGTDLLQYSNYIVLTHFFFPIHQLSGISSFDFITYFIDFFTKLNSLIYIRACEEQ